MELVKKFPETMDNRAVYKLLKSPEIKKMSDADGSILEVAAWIVYKDTDSRTGEQREILTLSTTDGEIFATVSATFMKEFAEIVKYFGDDVGAIKVVSGKSKAGRTYITCTVE